MPTWIKILIGGNEDTVTACLALFSIAVGVGSGLAAWVARGRIVLKTTLAGAVLLALFALLVAAGALLAFGEVIRAGAWSVSHAGGFTGTVPLWLTITVGVALLVLLLVVHHYVHLRLPLEELPRT